MERNVYRLAVAAMTGAAYAALTMLLAPISYMSVQFRVSEALCILPAFFPCTAWGLFAGCAVANLLSASGIPDIVFGSLATLGAALCSAALGRGGTRPMSVWRSVAVCLMPVVWNAPVVGAVLTLTSVPTELFWKSFVVMAAQVGAGELAVMFAVGLPLLRLLPSSGAFMKLVRRY